MTPFLGQLLLNRGLAHPEDARRFLFPSLSSLRDPSRLPEMSKAVARIRRALRDNEAIAMFGDSDVDGLTASAIVYEFLTVRLGHTRVRAHVSNRIRDGYGVPASILASLLRDGVTLAILLDCGTNQREEIETLEAHGIETIVLDHHVPMDAVAHPHALVNPHCGGPDGRELCSAGLALKLVQAWWPEDPERWRPLLDLAALGTLADYAPLRDDSRVIVVEGVRQLAQTARPGLQRLFEVLGIRDGTPDRLLRGVIPCLNAAGRLGDAQPVWRLFVTTSPEEAATLVEAVTGCHDHTKALHRRIVGEAYAHASRLHWKDRWVMVVGRRGWHAGLMGPIASQLVERYERPAIVLAIDERGMGVGSARAPSTVNLLDALRACDDLMLRYGGHPQACGLTVDAAQLPALEARLNQHFSGVGAGRPAAAALTIDLDASMASLATTSDFDELEQLAPFGPGNPRPTILLRAVRVGEQAAGGVHVTDGHHRLWVKTRLNNWASHHAYDLVGMPCRARERLALTLCDVRVSCED